ncbi:23S rRNA (uracil(1939)-C(5))-methyltransferase RlmD [Marinoscillum furvescens]|uniref:23S rRNA m(5)U-1939 methyltransferase n=1 Tax=Marinoscillum furvescens DSM 4134 TaxID=1122208 RepID=A0A3D9KWQ2_MARFU|nr:23S rRNA (uracil(1939)-C(5))-methyltransferase RlmD [Marinoscillum furvescens]RED91739.1 23S rRNA m(5)U-1939 methyltransferase [Marinoscillum furvescens DSM 4134]
MARRSKNSFVKRGEVIEITIREYAFGGKGIGKISNEHGDFVIFVPNTIPGQQVKAQVKKISKTYAECKLLEVIQPSPDEVEVPYQDIPGAPYIQLPLDKQHAYKKQSTLELYRRIGKVNDVASLFDEFVSSPATFHYRNKMEYAFSAIGYDRELKTDVDEFTLGFKKRGTWWCGDDLKKDSGLFDKELEDQLHLIKAYCKDTGLAPWHAPRQEGFFRYFVVRKSNKTNQLLFNLVTTSDGLEQFDLQKFADFLVTRFGERVAGLIHTTNDEVGDRTIATTGEIQLIYGEDKIVEELNGLNFEISMKSFFQTNPQSAEKLYNKVVDYALEKKETVDNNIVLDLFCGTGTIGQILASKSENAQIVGVDIVESAIENARENAERNGIKGVKFHAADVGKFLKEHPQYSGKIRTVILDPARAGIAPKTLQKIIDLNAERMVYVSCNPATQARDIEQLELAGYALKKFSLVDQFPHTAHVESVALLEK